MVHCPECGTTFEQEDDLEFSDLDSENQSFSLSLSSGMAKRFYVLSCGHCDHIIGSGVAGKIFQ